jgi:hypothetical protein
VNFYLKDAVCGCAGKTEVMTAGWWAVMVAGGGGGGGGGGGSECEYVFAVMRAQPNRAITCLNMYVRADVSVCGVRAWRVGA